MREIAARVRAVRERLARAALRAGRRPEEVKLIAVTKNVPVEAIREAVDAGIAAVGENRVQEAQPKVAALGRDVEWHFIGHLQTNKVKYLSAWASYIHSLDRLRLAQELEKQGARAGRKWRVLVQVNLTGEESKYGLAPEQLRPFLEKIGDSAWLEVVGLMTIAPFTADPEETRPVFRQLRELAEALRRQGWPQTMLEHLSMGMSNDFEVAVEEGATMIRVGTAIFGPRGR